MTHHVKIVFAVGRRFPDVTQNFDKYFISTCEICGEDVLLYEELFNQVRETYPEEDNNKYCICCTSCIDDVKNAAINLSRSDVLDLTLAENKSIEEILIDYVKNKVAEGKDGDQIP